MKKKLVGRLLDIVNGSARLPEKTRKAYIQIFQNQGYEIPSEFLREDFHYTKSNVLNSDKRHHCKNLLPVIHREPCSCGSTKKVDIHGCQIHRRCIITERNRKNIKDYAVRKVTRSCEKCIDYVSPLDCLPIENYPPHPIARHVTKFAVGVTAAPRKTSYLRHTVNSIIESGFTPTVYAEPDTDVSGIQEFVDDGKCYVVMRDTKHGCWLNYKQTLRDLVSCNPDAEAIMVFQDDCELARGTRDFLERDLWPSANTGVVSLYSPDSKLYEHHSQPKGFHEIKGSNRKWLLGAVAMIYPPHVAYKMAYEHNEWRGCARTNKTIEIESKKKAVDTWIGHVMYAENLKVFYPNPSICQHVALVSAVGHGGRDQKRKGTGFRYRRSMQFNSTEKSPVDYFEGNHPALRYNSDGSMRLDRKLSIVIPGWNCSDLTIKCLNALEEHLDVTPVELIYVDNGSDLHELNAIKEHIQKCSKLQDFKIIEFPENRGFSPAANAGMQAASGHVLLLNNDCFVKSKSISSLVHHLTWFTKAASVGPISDDNGKQSFKKNKNLASKQGKNHSIVVDSLSGFCQLIRQEAIADVGYLNEEIPYGISSDKEWCFRAKEKGWEHRINCMSSVNHLHGATFKRGKLNYVQMKLEAHQYMNSVRQTPEQTPEQTSEPQAIQTPIQKPSVFSAGIQSTARREPTLSYCVESIKLNGVIPFVVSEPDNNSLEGLDLPADRIIQNETKLGKWYNWKKVATYLLENTDSPYLFIFEDDTIVADGAFRFVESFLEKHGWPEDCGLISIYTPTHYTGKPGTFYKLDISLLWGSCGFLFQREALAKILETNTSNHWKGFTPEEDKSKVKNGDVAVGKAIREMGLYPYYFTPSLAQHIGKTSTLTNKTLFSRRVAKQVVSDWGVFDDIKIIEQARYISCK